MLRFNIFSIFVLSQIAIGQITINSTDLLGLIGTTQTMEADTTYSVSVNVGSAGANQSWDFTSVQTQVENSFSILSPNGTPFENDFPDANFVELYDFSSGDSIFRLYSYSDISSSVVRSLGEGTIFNIPGEIDTSFADINEDETPLPIEYGASWTEAYADTSDFGGFLTISADISEYTVDAWGTVTVAAGTFDCLRLRENYTSVTKSVIGEFEIPIDSTSGITYTWLSKTNLVICEIESEEGETNPEFTRATSFSRFKSGTTSLPENPGAFIANDFSLAQNYPNPFNPVTSIEYTIGKTGNVDLSVFDSAGRLIQTLVTGIQNSGTYSVQWDASGLASGVYYYRLKTPQFTSLKKAALLK